MFILILLLRYSFSFFSVNVRGIAGHTLMGIQIAFHRNKGDTEEFFGEFVEFPAEKVKALDCIDGKRVRKSF